MSQDNIFHFTQDIISPDPICNYESYADTQTPIVIDNGNFI